MLWPFPLHVAQNKSSDFWTWNLSRQKFQQIQLSTGNLEQHQYIWPIFIPTDIWRKYATIFKQLVDCPVKVPQRLVVDLFLHNTCVIQTKPPFLFWCNGGSGAFVLNFFHLLHFLLGLLLNKMFYVYTREFVLTLDWWKWKLWL